MTTDPLRTQETLQDAVYIWTGGEYAPDTGKAPWSRLRINLEQSRSRGPHPFLFWFIAGVHSWNFGRLVYANEVCSERTSQLFVNRKKDILVVPGPEQTDPVISSLLEIGRSPEAVLRATDVPLIARFALGISYGMPVDLADEVWSKGVLTLLGCPDKALRYPALQELVRSPDLYRRYVQPFLR